MTTENPREIFWLHAEPAYDRVDDLTRARLNAALDAALDAAGLLVPGPYVEPSVDDWEGSVPATMQQRVDFDTSPDRDQRCPGRVVAYADGRTGRCVKGPAGHAGECA